MLAAVGGVVLSWGACDPVDACCNSCGRSYRVGSPDDASLWIENIQEGGNECEIGDMPRAIPDGTSTLVAVAGTYEGAGEVDRVTVEDHAPGDAAAQLCEDLAVYTAEAFVDAEVAPGTRVCLIDEVFTELACTQLGCPEGLSCSMHPRRG